jgi:hypothetical protein
MARSSSTVGCKLALRMREAESVLAISCRFVAQPRIARRLSVYREVLHENHASSTGTRVVVDFAGVPTQSQVKRFAPVVPEGGDRFDTLASHRPARLHKGRIEEAADSATAEVRVDANEMHISRTYRLMRDETEEKSDHLPFLFDDEGVLAKLVEKDGVRKGADGATPPAVNDFDDLIEVSFGDRARRHEWQTYSRLFAEPAQAQQATGFADQSDTPRSLER